MATDLTVATRQNAFETCRHEMIRRSGRVFNARNQSIAGTATDGTAHAVVSNMNHFISTITEFKDTDGLHNHAKDEFGDNSYQWNAESAQQLTDAQALKDWVLANVPTPDKPNYIPLTADQRAGFEAVCLAFENNFIF